MAGDEGRHSVNQKQIPGFQSRRDCRLSRPPMEAEVVERQDLYFFNFYWSIADLKAFFLLKGIPGRNIPTKKSDFDCLSAIRLTEQILIKGYSYCRLLFTITRLHCLNFTR